MQKDGIDFADRTKRFALQVIRLSSILPRRTEAQVLGKQVLRSGTSVGANYCEMRRLAAWARGDGLLARAASRCQDRFSW